MKSIDLTFENWRNDSRLTELFLLIFVANQFYLDASDGFCNRFVTVLLAKLQPLLPPFFFLKLSELNFQN